MSISTIPDGEKYLFLLHKMITENRMVNDPKEIYSLVKVSKTSKGKLIGWEITNKEINFATNDKLDCDESAVIYSDMFAIKNFSYHFNPSGSDHLLSYRVDLELGDLHLNPDPTLEGVLEHRIRPDKLPVDINNFNCLLAIHLALQYIRNNIYPTDTTANLYNTVLEGIRRQIER